MCCASRKLNRVMRTASARYRLTFEMQVTRIVPLQLLQADAQGELRGRGTWTLAADNAAATRVHYEWRVCVTRRWMRLLAPLLRPAFIWNHNQVMQAGGEGLNRWLAARDDSAAFTATPSPDS